MINDIDEINVVIQDTDSVTVTEGTPTDIAEIMHNEEIRQENEAQRIENETAREDYINDLKQRVLDGEFNGQDGEDGFSPIANVSKSGDTATITITDKNGTTTASISDGTDGADGTDGEDGFSPVVSMEKQGKVTTLTITDATGVHTTEIRDGNDGSGTGDMLKATYDTNDNGVVDNAEKVNNHTVQSDVPANAVFTDTTYTAGTGIDITNNVISSTQTSAEWGNIGGDIDDQTDLQNVLNEKQNIIQYATMPTPSVELLNKIVQYVGTDTTTYRPFSFYTCKENDIGEGYHWIYSTVDALEDYELKIDSTHKLESDLVDDTNQDNKFLTGNAQTISGVKTFMALPQYYYDIDPVLDNELITKAYADNNFEYQKTSLPTASADFYGSVFQYVGTTTANYTNGYYYKCVRSGTSPNYTYSWERLDVQPSFSGDYNDLSNKPTIPDELADLSDDSTHRVVTDTEKTTWSGKQDALVSGTNIKTINNTSILGSGDIEVGADIPQQDTAPSNPQEDDLWIDTDDNTNLVEIDSTVSTTSTNPIENQAITNYVNSKLAITSYTFTPSYSSYTPTYKINRIGNIITLNINSSYLASISANTWTDLGSISNDIAPTTAITSCCVYADGNLGRIQGYGRAELQTNGTIRVKGGVTYNDLVFFTLNLTWTI